MTRGRAARKLAGLITRRSQVQILSSQPNEKTAHCARFWTSSKSIAFGLVFSFHDQTQFALCWRIGRDLKKKNRDLQVIQSINSVASQVQILSSQPNEKTAHCARFWTSSKSVALGLVFSLHDQVHFALCWRIGRD